MNLSGIGHAAVIRHEAVLVLRASCDQTPHISWMQA